MADYQRGKERIRDSFTTGVLNPGGNYVFKTDVRLGERACMIRKTETIDYNVGARFNACSAAKSIQFIGVPASRCCFGSPNWHTLGGSPEGQKPRCIQDESVIMYEQPIGVASIETSSDDVSQARFDAYQRLIYLVPGTAMNFGRALIELKDTKQTISQFVQFFKWCRKTTLTGGRHLPRAIRKKVRLFTVASSMASLASAYLWYTFGVEPTVSDIKRFIREMSMGKLKVVGERTKRRVPKGTVVVQRYSCLPRMNQVAQVMFDAASEPLGSGDGEGIVSLRRIGGPFRVRTGFGGGIDFPNLNRNAWKYGRTVTVRSLRGAYFAEVIRDIEIPGETELSRYMSWNCPLASSAWELIPFSFVLDWFVDVGKFISNLDHYAMGKSERLNLGPVWHSCQTVLDTWRPRLVAYNARAWPVAAPTNWGYGGTICTELEWRGQPALEDRTISYLREPGPRPGIPGITFSGTIKAYQISTGMALLMQAAFG